VKISAHLEMWLCVAFGLVALAFGILSWMIKERRIGSSDPR